MVLTVGEHQSPVRWSLGESQRQPNVLKSGDPKDGIVLVAAVVVGVVGGVRRHSMENVDPFLKPRLLLHQNIRHHLRCYHNN